MSHKHNGRRRAVVQQCTVPHLGLLGVQVDASMGGLAFMEYVHMRPDLDGHAELTQHVVMLLPISHSAAALEGDNIPYLSTNIANGHIQQAIAKVGA